MNILINASNLHVGGGVQVASSFLNELEKILRVRNVNANISVVVSTTVLDNLDYSFDKSVFDKFSELNIFGFDFRTRYKRNFFLGYDVIFTVFGPLYFHIKNTHEVTGFAQPWIAYPDNLVYEKINILDRIKNRLNFYLKEIYFKKSSILIVEANHVKSSLVKLGYNKNNIKVVSNTISNVFFEDDWTPINYKKSNKFTLGFIGRNYIHKNISILKDVNLILKRKYNTFCDFLFTLNDDEMINNGFDKFDNFYSVGEIKVEQCPSFYQQIDALIFPSLLECFSAAPIEAMKMGKLVIASDLPFISDVCKSSARYFDPLSAESIALSIYKAINEPEINEMMIMDAKNLVHHLPTAKDRAEAYLNILLNIK
ncbi:glycosyltransferase [Photobacterium leiognathi]|uniref:glycosyltransferase n=1 Tax=Photobacterium leiognathi TaxID=553611 RepID=UPI002739B02B|nr:glycosyltransferase [Photobacterium leiognathi]